jgi:hypothetical protein
MRVKPVGMKKAHPESPVGSPRPQQFAYSRRGAAAALGISPASLDRLVQRGLLRPSRALRKPLFSASELERFLQETTASV